MALGGARRAVALVVHAVVARVGHVADAAIVDVWTIGAAERNRRVEGAGFVGQRREEADAYRLARAARRAAVFLGAVAVGRGGVAEAIAERAAVDVRSARVT